MAVGIEPTVPVMPVVVGVVSASAAGQAAAQPPVHVLVCAPCVSFVYMYRTMPLSSTTTSPREVVIVFSAVTPLAVPAVELGALVAELTALVEAAGVATDEEHAATRVRLAAVVTAARSRRRSERWLVIVWDIVPSLQAARASRLHEKTSSRAYGFR